MTIVENKLGFQKVLITPIAPQGQEAFPPFEVEGELTSKFFPECGLIYYIGGASYPERILKII